MTILFASAGSLLGSGLAIKVRHMFQGAPLQLDSLRYTNAAGERLSVSRVSYLLSGFALETLDRTWVELPGQYAWIDASEGRNEFRLTGVPAGNYRSLRFYFGLEPTVNHTNSAAFPPEHPLNPNLNGLHWSWQGGYIFLALEGLYRANGTSPWNGYAYHFARDTNRTLMTLQAPIDLSHEAGVALGLDLAALLGGTRPFSFTRDGASTHSRDGDPVTAALAAGLSRAVSLQRVESRAALPAEGKPASTPGLPPTFTPYRFAMSAKFPVPDLPRDNPLMEERVALGRALFHETRLSRDSSLSCASCHYAAAGFAETRRYSIGVRGQTGTRNAMPLFNLAWKTSFFWDGRATSLRDQALMPVQDHAEMDETLPRVVEKLSHPRKAPGQDPSAQDGARSEVSAAVDFPALFERGFGSAEITAERIGLALEQFLLTLTSCDSRFDRALREEETLSAAEQRGFELFMTEYEPRTGRYGADCFHCHGGPLLTDHAFHNNGLERDSGRDLGRFRVTGREADRGKFATPSLRNIALTAPYMHDGRFATLEEVVEHYSAGVKRSATLDPNLAKHPESGLQLSAEDQHALVAFLKTLTDESLGGETNDTSHRTPSRVSRSP